MPELRDHLCDLEARQLATLAGLGTLSDLDLELAAIGEIFGGDAETARSDLLDGGTGIVPIRLWPRLRWILAAFAGIRLGSDPIHRDAENLMRLRGKRAERHSWRDKALSDLGDRLHLFDGNGCMRRAKIHQLPKAHRRLGSHAFGIFAERRVG